MVVPLGSKGQAATSAPAGCYVPDPTKPDPRSVIECFAAICARLPGGCTPANYLNFSNTAFAWMGQHWRTIYHTALDKAHPDMYKAMLDTSIWNQLYRFNNMVAGSMRPALAGIATGATAALGAAQATGTTIAGAASTAVNTAGAAAAAAGNAVAGAGAATVVAGGVAVVGGAAVVTLTGMLAYESVRWRYAAVESERLEVEACKAISRTNLSLYNHFLDPANGSPTRGQCQSYYEFNTRCRRHIESSIPVILSPSCM